MCLMAGSMSASWGTLAARYSTSLQFVANHNNDCSLYSFFAVHLAIVCWETKGFCSTSACTVLEQCHFKNTRSSDLEGMRLTITVSILDPPTHFPFPFINARLSQVFKSPAPVIAFVRFVSLPRRFTPLSTVTAFSILPFIHSSSKQVSTSLILLEIHSFVHIYSKT